MASMNAPRGAPNLVTTHDTPGGDEEEHPPDPPKSAAFRPCDEPEQCPNEALDKESPTDEEEPSTNKDFADVEESDGPIGDQRWRVKETFREEILDFFADWANYFQLVERLVP
ncbi:hypothetical protein E4U25_007575 [Claviceps purpurea]|nr:hypothetical protein E4U25_007575 [Claviceps purpurea]